jgi:glycerol-3-phosphate dehydrogenase (NAD(P)+)
MLTPTPDSSKKVGSVTVVGGGAWGIALAAAAARVGTSVILLSRRPKPTELPASVRVVRDVEEAVKHARLLVLAAPSSACRTVARELGDHMDGGQFVVHGVRGLVGDGLETVSAILREETPTRRIGALGGPALAHDLLEGRPSVLVAGSRYPEVTSYVTASFGAPTLRVYPTRDMVGLEWASALVGCLTIAVGYAQAVKMSPGLIAALITRSIGEASRIAAAAGGEPSTLLGLSGYGDLLASMTQTERPEVLVGTALGLGKGRDEAVRAAALRTEALELIPRVAHWADKHGVRVPIFRALCAVVTDSVSADKILDSLMAEPMDLSA